MNEISLYQALLLLKNPEECQAFLTDLCTPQEMSALSERWRVCQLLSGQDLSYRDIHKVTGASLTTIGRVARYLNIESNKGYKLILDRIGSSK